MDRQISLAISFKSLARTLAQSAATAQPLLKFAASPRLLGAPLKAPTHRQRAVQAEPTTKLSLRPLTITDAEPILNLMDQNVCDNLAIDLITNLTQAEDFIHGVGSTYPNRYGAHHSQHGLVGTLAWGIHQGDSAYLCYWIAPSFQGQGFGKAAVTQLIKRLKAFGLTHLYAEVFSDNLASQQLLSNLGFCIVHSFIHPTQRHALCLRLDIEAH